MKSICIIRIQELSWTLLADVLSQCKPSAWGISRARPWLLRGGIKTVIWGERPRDFSDCFYEQPCKHFSFLPCSLFNQNHQYLPPPCHTVIPPAWESPSIKWHLMSLWHDQLKWCRYYSGLGGKRPGFFSQISSLLVHVC